MTSKKEYSHLLKLSQGNLKSFRWIYDEHHKQVFSFCLKLVGNHQVAEEITEDVFIKLWEKRTIIKPAYSINHLLFKITKDYSWNYLKKYSRIKEQQAHFLEEKRTRNTSDFFSELVLKDYWNIVEEAVLNLPKKRQKVFELHYKNGLDNQEIARQLNISESTVRVHLFKATKFLRSYLKTHPEISFISCLLFALLSTIC